MSEAVRLVDLIDRKRRGLVLTADEIAVLIADYTAGTVPDYQMAALLMAILWRGMDEVETTALTQAMARSGALLDLSDIAPVIADKHSTGGVGDKATLVVAPLVAAAGVHVGKMSGRGLGHTGGTIDKLESIDGLETRLSAERFRQILRQERLVIAGQSAELAPADGQLYALRDVTATVQSIPLIASSIMAKKLAAGATTILLDVKVGRGAFMAGLAEARRLATLMVAIGRGAGRQTQAVISAMEQPLGRAVGNALEVAEAVAALTGGGPDDLVALGRHAAAELLVMAGVADEPAAAEQRVQRAIDSGAGLERLAAMVAAQGGDARQIEQPARLPTAPVVERLLSHQAGWVAAIDALAIGQLVMRLGGGRADKGAAIDHRVGVVLRAKVGERVAIGQPLAEVHAAEPAAAAAGRAAVMAALRLSEAPVERPDLILDEIGRDL